ncbi:hypothetical protein DFH07DRAFT_973832 [Mycena maculata]|uniref:Uncharacterized protein n=1 Tax=Mycena maculata TaxID=230809 RepID=A0AAD7HBN7_9AGAR|nr:hypothetical protein DFH07DRAFT_973832 [Mycena maculata]
MITVDDKGHMVPGFTYLSGNTTKESQVIFLRKAKHLVEKMAADLISGKVKVAPGLEEHTQALMESAALVVKNGWRPKFFMIDKYCASKAAIKHDAIAEGSRTTSQTLWEYFDANWFCDEWREHWTDMGLPEGENRDGMLSTNNWTERAFKTFNQIFLGNRNNKS